MAIPPSTLTSMPVTNKLSSKARNGPVTRSSRWPRTSRSSFCDPRNPSQRGTDENTNGLLGQYMPKGIDISNYSQARLNAVARQLNERPRKTLASERPLRCSANPLHRPVESAPERGRSPKFEGSGLTALARARRRRRVDRGRLNGRAYSRDVASTWTIVSSCGLIGRSRLTPEGSLRRNQRV